MAFDAKATRWSRRSLFTATAALLAVLALSAQADIHAYWNFNEGSGTTARTGGNGGGSAALHNISWADSGATSASTSALVLNGTDAWAEVPAGALSKEGNQTVALWVKLPKTQTQITGSNQDNDIVEKWNGGGPYPYVLRLFNRNSSDNAGRVLGAIYDSTGKYISAISATAINDERWHHIAFVRDGKTLKLYVDGKLDASAPDTTTGTTSNNTPLYLGSRSGSQNFLTGSLDQLNYWDQALSDTEVAALAAACSGTGKNYSGQNCTDHNFSNQDLSGANFSNAMLDGASFKGATLTGASFKGATLGKSSSSGRSTSFTEANLSKADFSTTIVGSAEFELANLNCTLFANTDISQATFGPTINAADPGGSCRTSFAGARMNCQFLAQWKDLDLTGANVKNCLDALAGQDFSKAWMREVNFDDADLTATTFDGADLRQACFGNASAAKATFKNQARLSGAHMSGITLSGADLTSAVLAASDELDGADLSYAYMPNAILTSAQMTGVTLAYANFYGSNGKTDSATMEQVSFANANLGSLDLSQGALRGAQFVGANLVNANLSGADLRAATSTTTSIPAALTNANLQGANLTQAKLQGADLSNAAIALDEGVKLFALEDADDKLSGDLDKGWLSSELVDDFSSKGYVLKPCVDPQLLVITPSDAWEVSLQSPVGESGKTKYQRFSLSTDFSNNLKVSGVPLSGSPAMLFSLQAASLSKDYPQDLNNQRLARAILQAFTDNGYPLPACTNPVVTVGTAGAEWGLLVTLTEVKSAGLGYTGFTLIETNQTIAVYGNQITVVRPDEKNNLTLVEIPVKKTLHGCDEQNPYDCGLFDENSTLPNRKSYGANKQDGSSWEEMMTAATLPAPPNCIPTPQTWCSQPPTQVRLSSAGACQ